MVETFTFVPAYFASTICIGTLAAALILMSGIRHKRPEFLALTFVCVLSVSYQYLTWQYHTSSNLKESLYWLKLQSAIILLIFPPYFYTFAKWTTHPKVNRWTYLIIAFVLVLSSLNYVSEFSLRFSTIEKLDFIKLWSGETISLIRGEQSIIGKSAHLISLFVLMSLVVMVRRLYLLGAIGIAFVLALSLVLQLFASVLGLSIDAGVLNFIYVAALPLIILCISICVLGAYTLRSQTEALSTLNAKHISLEQSFSELARGSNLSNSNAFYRHMLESLYNLSKADYIFIGIQNTDGNRNYITTKTVLKLGKLAPNFTYDLKDTPCAKVMDNETCVYNANVANLFPNDQLLTDMNIQAYLGTPLLGENSSLIGILTLLHTQAIEQNNQILEAVQIFAARAAAEIRRDTTEAKLRSLAYTDYSTGLASKARAYEVLNQTITERELDNGNALLMLIDISDFGKLNQRLGYDVGEEILRELGNRLIQYQNDNVFVARYGGDEFAIIFKKISHQPIHFMDVHWDALQAILCKPVQRKSSIVNLKFKMGAVIFPEQTGRKYDVLQCAEMALSDTKKAVNCAASLFEPESLKIRERYQLIYNQLLLAISSNEQLTMVYQPKTKNQGELIGVEALIRWNHPKYGFISPAEFIPIAESSGLIAELGNWVVTEVCQQIATWKTRNFECKVAINVSASQLLDDKFVLFFIDKLAEYAIAPSSIELEITESGLINDINTAATMIQKFREIGLSIALDDFGTGYSSLSYLRELPLDVLKIDKAFVDKINEESAAELIKTIIAIAKQLSLDIVAEGTEYKEQVTMLSNMGCKYFQGYYFSRPLNGNDIPSWRFEAGKEA